MTDNETKITNEKQLARANEFLHALEPYGQVQVVREMARRIQALDKSDVPLNGGEAAHLAQLAVAHDLNPFSGEVWAWIQIKDGKRHFNWMPGRRGIIRHANEQAAAKGAEWWDEIRQLNRQEKNELAIPEDAIAFECRLFESSTWTPWNTTFMNLINAGVTAETALKMIGNPPATIGYGVLTQEEIKRMPRNNKMPHANRAKKRARMEALKSKYNLHFGGSAGHGGGDTFEDYIVDAEGAIDVDFEDVTEQEPYGVEAGSYGGRDRLNPKFWKGACEKMVEAELARDAFVAAELLAYSMFIPGNAKGKNLTDFFTIAKDLLAEMIEAKEIKPDETPNWKELAKEAYTRLFETNKQTDARLKREAKGEEPEPYVGTKAQLDADGLDGLKLKAYMNMARDYPQICPKHSLDWGTAYKYAGQAQSGITSKQFQEMVKKNHNGDVRMGMAELLGYLD
jgi:hypothetical protein